MKKIIICTLILLAAFTGNLFAQGSKPVKTGNEWRMPADAITRSAHFTDTLTKTFALDAATRKKLFDAYLANTKAVDEIPVLPISEEEKKARLKANKAAFDETIKGILTPAQFSGYVRMGLR
jgi:hypothetical protein